MACSAMPETRGGHGHGSLFLRGGRRSVERPIGLDSGTDALQFGDQAVQFAGQQVQFVGKCPQLVD
jgi:hypothetical protein